MRVTPGEHRRVAAVTSEGVFDVIYSSISGSFTPSSTGVSHRSLCRKYAGCRDEKASPFQLRIYPCVPLRRAFCRHPIG